ncbi:membrane-bound lytic murein transglycosylase MltF [Thiohalorhabdus methylotrophus]|uniref:Membrane-bound lytic murein transglycosylase F n=1 Tax=Thiohalorhabdus methylotrophus TaxID=3242694 RepID=A0ABV4TUY0_9GAMM
MGRTLKRAARWLGRPCFGGLWLLTGSAAVLTGCGGGDGGPHGEGALERIRASGELRVLTRNSPTTYYYGREGETGLEYDLARKLAEELGVELHITVIDDMVSLLDALEAGEGHIAAAGITRTRSREARFDFGPTYQKVRQQVVCKRGGAVPDAWEELPEVDLLVLAGTSYVERLREVKQVVHGLEWRTTSELSMEQVLLQLRKGEADCTVADSNIVAVNQRYYPDLTVAFSLSEDQELAWALPRGSTELQARLRRWFASLKEEHELAALRERYYGHIKLFDYVDIATFQQRIRNRLPEYMGLFKKVAAKYPFNWRLLAAQAYQESHWRPRAESPTGVRGMMMLTLTTARSLGIEDRIHVENSIRGGAEYLQRMFERLPDSIRQPDRTWIALAAYNVGMGHVWDARRLARRFDRDPDSWNALKEMLPLLSQRKYYKDLPYGYARGMEPVQYVQRIRQYRAILAKQFREEDAKTARTKASGPS